MTVYEDVVAIRFLIGVCIFIGYLTNYWFLGFCKNYYHDWFKKCCDFELLYFLKGAYLTSFIVSPIGLPIGIIVHLLNQITPGE